ncbi:MAG: hypothetical protein SPE48_03295 [Treponema porcinum]|nr:hypothetical protein [Treponema porcinum]MDY5120920.1 hypothetical protein [Treponema porcinum]
MSTILKKPYVPPPFAEERASFSRSKIRMSIFSGVEINAPFLFSIS